MLLYNEIKSCVCIYVLQFYILHTYCNMGAGCSTASVLIQMDEIVAIARSNRIEEALLKEEVVNIIRKQNLI